MQIIKINVYSIDELKTINKKKYDSIIEDEKQSLIDLRFDCAMDDIHDLMKYEFNFNDPAAFDYCYSISYCQGDGVSFTGSNILSYSRMMDITHPEKMNYFEKHLFGVLSASEYNMLTEYLNCGYNLSIKRDSHHYTHAYTCSFDYESFYSSDDSNYCELMDDLMYKICKLLFDNVYVHICESIEKMLYQYYDVDDDEILEFLNDNDYQFTKEGYCLC